MEKAKLKEFNRVSKLIQKVLAKLSPDAGKEWRAQIKRLPTPKARVAAIEAEWKELKRG